VIFVCSECNNNGIPTHGMRDHVTEERGVDCQGQIVVHGNISRDLKNKKTIQSEELYRGSQCEHALNRMACTLCNIFRNGDARTQCFERVPHFY
jgi:hypothetical protein